MIKGTLFYIIGASGVGKDSIINELKNRLTYKDGFIFTKRFITRANSESTEKHIAISKADFNYRLAHQLFALNWEANGNAYGIGIEIEYWTANGYDIIVNGSREYLEIAKTKYSNLKSILIDAEKSVIYERLIGRKRESIHMIEKRMERNYQFKNMHFDLIINNDSTIEASTNKLLKYINSIKK
jgi:ribose 1,5-bisphosphokinase